MIILASHAPNGPRSPRTAGFTLLEVLVVIAIIGILVALVVPAVQRAREAAHRTECANHLHQIGLTLHMHHDAYHVFPSNGGWDGKQTILDVSGQPVRVQTYDIASGQTFTWGVGDPGRGPTDQTGSWAYAILPYVEQAAMFRQRAWGVALPLYSCPSRRPPTALPATNDQYGDYQGGGWVWARIDYGANARVIPNRPQCMRMAQITDGLSQTILAGEKAMSPLNYSTGTWYWDEPFFLGGSGGTQRGFGAGPTDGLRIIPDNPNMGVAFRYNWGAAHPGGAQFLLADGSVRLLPFFTLRATVLALLTPNGNDVISDF